MSATSSEVIKSAMGLARHVAERPLDSDVLDVVSASLAGATSAAQMGDGTGADLDRLIVEDLHELFADVQRGGPLWDIHIAITRKVLAQGGLPDDEVARITEHAEWANIGIPHSLTRRAHASTQHPVEALSSTKSPDPPLAETQAHLPVVDDVDDETGILDAEVVECVGQTGSSQRRYRAPGGYNPRAHHPVFGRSITGRSGPSVYISTDSPDLADHRGEQ